jgi:hypothetical protein
MNALEITKVITLVLFCLAMTMIYAFVRQRCSRPAGPSKYFLLYPCLAAANAAAYADTTIGVVISVGVANVGYMLLAAGIIRGRFTAFGLEKRAVTIIAGIVCLAAGSAQATFSAWH